MHLGYTKSLRVGASPAVLVTSCVVEVSTSAAACLQTPQQETHPAFAVEVRDVENVDDVDVTLSSRVPCVVRPLELVELVLRLCSSKPVVFATALVAAEEVVAFSWL